MITCLDSKPKGRLLEYIAELFKSTISGSSKIHQIRTKIKGLIQKELRTECCGLTARIVREFTKWT
jgi:hypothetical protein